MDYSSDYDDACYDRLEQLTAWAVGHLESTPKWITNFFDGMDFDADEGLDKPMWSDEILNAWTLEALRDCSNMVEACDEAADAIRAGCTLREWTGTITEKRGAL